MALSILSFFFFFNDTATTEIYTLSLHDALPISKGEGRASDVLTLRHRVRRFCGRGATLSMSTNRSEEHTSELQSQSNLVCRLLLEKKKKTLHVPFQPHAATHSRHSKSLRSSGSF